VHDNFGALDPAPFALTQLSEWSENDQERADTWEALRKATVAERNGDAKLNQLYARVKVLANQKRALEQKARSEFKDLPSTVKAEQEIKELKAKAGALLALIREDKEYTKLSESIRVCDQQRRAIQKAELPNQVDLAKKSSELQRLKLKLSDLSARLKATRPELSKLEKLVREKQGALNTARKRHEEKQRGQDEYIQITEAYAATNKALGDEKNRLLEAAGVSGRNPFARPRAVKLKEFQQSVKYHSTADWDHRTREEVSGAVPPKMKNWLLRVRGF
jgi:chromosome segregation ATPase